MERTSAKSLSTPSLGRNGVGSSRSTRPGLSGHRPCGFDLLEGPDDGEQGALDGRQTIHPLVGVEMESEAAQRSPRRRALGRPVDEYGLRRGELHQPEVLEDRQRRHQPEILMHEGHAEAAIVAGLQRQGDGFAVERQAAARIRARETRRES